MTVIKTCMQCGAVNSGAESSVCCFCDAPLVENLAGNAVSTPRSPATEGNLAVKADWQNEVAHRLTAYRTRRRRLHTDPAQPEFSFEPDEIVSGKQLPAGASAKDGHEPAPAGVAASEPVPAIQSWRCRPNRVERIKIDLAQPSEFAHTTESPDDTSSGVVTDDGPVPIAPLSERRLAGLADAALLLFAYGGFLALFGVLGGRFTGSKLDIAVAAATLVLFYVQYFTLFSFFGGATPGMMIRKLRVVSYDGAGPTPRQLLWRSFGYLISAGTVMLGFVWALWDEDHLSWHDRISHTYLTLESPEIERSSEVVEDDFERHLQNELRR